MADDIQETQEIEEELEEEVQGTEDLETEEEEEKEEEQDGEGVVKGILAKLGIGKKSEEESEETEEEGEFIPEEFVKAAKATGWTDEEIEEFASEYSDEELIEQIAFLEAETQGSVSESEKEAAVSEPEPSKLTENADVQELVKQIKAEVTAEFEAKFGKLTEQDEQRQAQDTLERISRSFDNASKEFEIFGKTDELPRFPAGQRKGQLIPTSPQFKARSEVYDHANLLMSTGQPVEEAMDLALMAYKGKYLAADIKRNMVKDLKRSEKKVSARRSGKEAVKTYVDEDDRREDVVKQIARKAGVKEFGN